MTEKPNAMVNAKRLRYKNQILIAHDKNLIAVLHLSLIRSKFTEV